MNLLWEEKNTNCLLNLRSNAYFNSVVKDQVKCLDPIIDGYVSRIIRLSLTLIDLLQPYIVFHEKVVKNADSTYTLFLKWNVGGSLNVDETIVLSSFVNDEDSFRKKVENISNNSELINHFKFKSKPQNGLGIWNQKFNESSYFKYKANLKSSKKYFAFVILAKVDQNWSSEKEADPPINPQSHIINLRTMDDYISKNKDFELKGNIYARSEIKFIKLNEISKRRRRRHK